MTRRSRIHLVLAMVLTVLAALGCERDTAGLEPAPLNTDPIVFDDDFGSSTAFHAFLGSKLDAVSIDTEQSYVGGASLKVTVPGPGATDGGYAGGAIVAGLARTLTQYNALTFFAKASIDGITFDTAGLGNDNTGNSKYTAQWKGIALSQNWQKFVIPIPLSDRLVSEQGMFFFAEGPEGAGGHEVWFDDIKFEVVEGITNPRPSMRTATMKSFVGETVAIANTRVIFDVNGVNQVIEHMPGYFDFSSSDTDVVEIIDGEVKVVGAGTADITGALGDTEATGKVTVIATAPPAVPAPTPTHAKGDVISLFSDQYDDVAVGTWSATWDNADVADLLIGGNQTKVYTNLSYAGIEFGPPTIDASEMNFFHVDVWIPAGNEIRIKLVDFGEDGTYLGAPDSESELKFNPQSDPPLVFGSWVSLDLPLADFTRLASRAHLAQLILWADTSTSTVYVDNVYFHK